MCMIFFASEPASDKISSCSCARWVAKIQQVTQQLFAFRVVGQKAGEIAFMRSHQRDGFGNVRHF